MTQNEQETALLHLGAALRQENYHHITVTPATHARVNARKGNEWAADLNGVFGWSRPFRAGIMPAHLLELMRKAGIVVACEGGWRSTLRASTLNGHLYFHSAWPTDPADAVFFGPDTYRYLDALFDYLQANHPAIRRAVDIGCGAGPGAVELALRLPDAQVLAVDINDAALRLTRVNASLADARIEVLYSDLLADVDGSIDLVISNPPYMLDPATRAYRHGGGTLGAGLSQDIISASLQRLGPGGTLLLYTGSAIVEGEDRFLLAARGMLQGKCSWSYREIDPDVFGEELDTEAYREADRIAAVLLCATLPA